MERDRKRKHSPRAWQPPRVLYCGRRAPLSTKDTNRTIQGKPTSHSTLVTKYKGKVFQGSQTYIACSAHCRATPRGVAAHTCDTLQRLRQHLMSTQEDSSPKQFYRVTAGKRHRQSRRLLQTRKPRVLALHSAYFLRRCVTSVTHNLWSGTTAGLSACSTS